MSNVGVADSEATILQLREEIARLKVENDALRSEAKQPNRPSLRTRDQAFFCDDQHGVVDHLSSDEIERYSRQLLLEDGFGVDGQCKLLSSSVLVVGAGGIGSTGEILPYANSSKSSLS
jgi:hypothetical protein